MDVNSLTSLVSVSDQNTYLKFISDKGKNSCEKCLQYHEKIYNADDAEKPKLPLHPNCRCQYKLIEFRGSAGAALKDVDDSSKITLNSPGEEKELILLIAKEEYTRQSKIKYDPLEACGLQSDELASKLYVCKFNHWNIWVIRGSRFFIVNRWAMNTFRLQTQHHVVLVDSRDGIKNSFILDTFKAGDIDGKTTYLEWKRRNHNNFTIIPSGAEEIERLNKKK